jgi:two-component system CheB/CheR fusion protein
MRQNDNRVSVGSQSKKGSPATSCEELWSRNEDLSDLSIQLQIALKRRCAISSHLQNLRYSADVATVFPDSDLNIRFFHSGRQIPIQHCL